MPYFHCTFVNIDGHFTRREIYALNKKELKKNYANAEEKLLACRRILFREFSIGRWLHRKVNYNDFLRFNQELAILIRAGIPLVRALEIINENRRRGILSEILKKAMSDIQSGVQISEAFNHPQIPFYKIYKASLLAGEKSGSLDVIFDKFNIYLSKMALLRQKIISSLTYPAVLFGFMIVMFSIMTLVVIPRFTSLYESFDAELPSITIFFLETTDFLKSNFLFILGVFVFSYVFVKILEHTRPEIIIIDKLKIRLPFIGRVILESSMAIFSRTLAILASGGIPIPESVEISSETISNRYISSYFDPLSAQIREGNSLSQVLGKIPLIPPIFVEMTKVGETSGKLPHVLDESADFYERSIEIKINALISLIEPVIIITLGAVIALMILSVYMPIFSSIKAIQ